MVSDGGSPDAKVAGPRQPVAGKLRHRLRIAPFIALSVVMAGFSMIVAVGVIDLLAAGRAYVGGESIWSRAHHTAVFHLDQFAETGDPERLRMARTDLEIPLTDRLARLELEDRNPDYDRARALFEEAGNHPDDVPRMVRLFRYFRNWPAFSRAVELWTEADVWIIRLDQLADELEGLWNSPAQNAEQIASIRSELSLISRTLDEKAQDFSAAVNEGSRWLSSLVLWISLCSLALLVALLIALFIWAMRGVRRSQRRFWNTFEHAPVGMALIDSAGSLMEVNDSLCRFLERDQDQLIASSLTQFCDSRDRSVLRRTLSERNHSAHPLLNLESRYIRPDGSPAWGKLSIASLGEEIKGSGLFVAVLEDISESRSLSAELAYQAAHDQLTGLANRREFERELNHLLHDSGSSSGRHALGLIDLDQFKVVNDAFGHLAGDALLVRLAEKIHHCLRDGDLLARLDGDQFGVILRNCGIETATQVANRLRDAVGEFPFSWEERPISVSASIGIVEINGSNRDASLLMQRVDLACYEAKDLGRNQVSVHAESGASSIKRRQEMSWVNRINEAVAANRLRFHGQLISPASDDDWRCELLVRLEDADGKLHTANVFMEAAEHYHVARTIDRWVVGNALERISAIRTRHPRIGTWHINLSGQSVDCDIVLPELLDQIKAHNIEPGILCFEITESAAIHSLEEARRFFTALRDLGCQVALDDFGKGLSTFDYLKQLPVDLVKIDGSFVRELAHSELDHAMVRSIHEVARIAGKRTIAESVESIELILRLKQIGIDYLQGHAIHNPEPLSKLQVPTLDNEGDAARPFHGIAE